MVRQCSLGPLSIMNVYDFKVEDKQGNEVSLSEYKGDVSLIVNTATECGFTPQYKDLERLYEEYKDKGFVVLDFPCNQFGGQAPGTDEEITSFCSLKFGVKYPQFHKVDVNGPDASPLFKYLEEQKAFEGFDKEHKLTPVLEDLLSKADPNYDKSADIKWNFTKFLVDREGNVVARFEPTKDMAVVEQAIKDLL